MRTSPLLAVVRPLAMPSRVDFPAPFSPTKAWTVPAETSTVTSRSA
jgi:hypothetical protein